MTFISVFDYDITSERFSPKLQNKHLKNNFDFSNILHMKMVEYKFQGAKFFYAAALLASLRSLILRDHIVCMSWTDHLAIFETSA